MSEITRTPANPAIQNQQAVAQPASAEQALLQASQGQVQSSQKVQAGNVKLSAADQKTANDESKFLDELKKVHDQSPIKRAFGNHKDLKAAAKALVADGFDKGAIKDVIKSGSHDFKDVTSRLISFFEQKNSSKPGVSAAFARNEFEGWANRANGGKVDQAGWDKFSTLFSAKLIEGNFPADKAREIIAQANPFAPQNAAVNDLAKQVPKPPQRA